VTVAIARQVALEVLMRVEADDAYANLLLNQLSTSKRLDSRKIKKIRSVALPAASKKKIFLLLIKKKIIKKKGLEKYISRTRFHLPVVGYFNCVKKETKGWKKKF
jgi:hypothetical protein